MARITPAAKKALLWLYDQGGDVTNAGKMSAALNSLSLCGGPALVKSEWGDFGPRGGRELRWWLTPRGISAAQAELAQRKERA